MVVRRETLKVFVNYPETEEGKKILLDNLATFKAELLLKGIEDIKAPDEVKEKVLDKVLEILSSDPNGVI